VAPSELTVVEATYRHALDLAFHLFEGERDELEAHFGGAPLDAVLRGLTLSAESYAVLDGSCVVAMFGVVPDPKPTLLGGQVGALWFLTAEAFLRVARQTLRLARRVLPALLERYTALAVFIDARYVASLRLARFLGFALRPAVPFGAAGLPFHCAVLERS
jgi:hypothetical protein